MKTYAIYNADSIELVMTTDDVAQVMANCGEESFFAEVAPGFRADNFRVIGGEIVSAADGGGGGTA